MINFNLKRLVENPVQILPEIKYLQRFSKHYSNNFPIYEPIIYTYLYKNFCLVFDFWHKFFEELILILKSIFKSEIVVNIFHISPSPQIIFILEPSHLYRNAELYDINYNAFLGIWNYHIINFVYYSASWQKIAKLHVLQNILTVCL